MLLGYVRFGSLIQDMSDIEEMFDCYRAKSGAEFGLKKILTTHRYVNCNCFLS